MRYPSQEKIISPFNATQETSALLKVLALGDVEVEKGKVKPVADVVQRLRAKGVRGLN